MTPSARLAAAVDILSRHFTAPQQPFDNLIAAWLRGKRYVGGSDRRSILAILYSIQRNRAKLLWHLSFEGTIQVANTVMDPGHVPARLAGMEAGRAFVLAALLLIDEQSPSALEHLFEDDQYGLGPATRADHNLIFCLSGRKLKADEMPDWIMLECPKWANLISVCPESEIPALMAALNSEAGVDLRVNSLVMTREAAIKQLARKRIASKPLPYTPYGIRLEQRVNLAALQCFKDGGLEPQDQGAQLAALLCDTQPGDRVVDFCAGAGGKTLALAAEMENRGHIVACDVLEGRLKRSQTRLKRAKVHNVATRSLTSEADPWIKRHKAKFDKVLLDVPCSGVGVWRRNPEARWRHNSMADLDSLIGLQSRILHSAARLCKPGGLLIYVTCSLLKAENDARIQSFLKDAADFSLVNLHTHLDEISKRYDLKELSGLCPDIGTFGLQLWPHRHDCDGFFISLLRRN